MALTYEHSSTLPFSNQSCFDWHLTPCAFERLTPPWENIKVVKTTGAPPRTNSTVELVQRIGPIKLKWLVEHTEFQSDLLFVDQMRAGPFSYWCHEHHFEPLEQGSLYRDRIEFSLPLGMISNPLGGSLAKSQLKRLFYYRHQIVNQDLALIEQYKKIDKKPILITGATGLIGSVFRSYLTNAGHEVRVLTRDKGSLEQGEYFWDPDSGELDRSALENIETVIHLAGAPIAAKRWSKVRKKIIEESRVKGTRLLVDAILENSSSIKNFISASAIGFYGDTGDQIATEEDSPYSDLFVSTSTRKWEAASAPLQKSGCRVALLRFGVVLSPAGGALQKMLLPFLLGVGGKVGSGKQSMSWIAIDDVLGALLHVLHNQDIKGPINFVAPKPISNKEFSETFAKVLKRPCLFPLPAKVVKLIFGQLGVELLLASVGASPKRLEESGYKFKYPELEPALRHLLGRV